MNNLSITVICGLLAARAGAQVLVPEGTSIRVKREDPSGPPEAGRVVGLRVTQPVILGNEVVIEYGARVEAIRDARSLSPTRVQTVDGNWLSLDSSAIPAPRTGDWRGTVVTARNAALIRGSLLGQAPLTHVARPGDLQWVMSQTGSFASERARSSSDVFMIVGVLLMAVGVIHQIWTGSEETSWW